MKVDKPHALRTATRSRAAVGAAVLASLTLLAGCDMLGVDTPAKQAERREADGRAIGAACRHTLRSLEDCYTNNPRASKAAIFAGWREMDEYMRENEIPGVPPAPAPVAVAPAASTGPGEEVVKPNGSTAPGATGGAAAPSAPPTGSIVPRISPRLNVPGGGS